MRLWCWTVLCARNVSLESSVARRSARARRITVCDVDNVGYAGSTSGSEVCVRIFVLLVLVGVVSVGCCSVYVCGLVEYFE